MNLYTKLIIFYFSGTGNAKKAAQWIIKSASEKGIETELINIDHYKLKNENSFDEKTLIGFCSPTHGFNLPPIMLDFVFHFPKSKGAKVFLLNTRAGMKMYKIFLPGLSGIAQYLPAVMLRLKGYRIVGMQPMDLPSNWISIHPGLRQKVVDSIFNRCKNITLRFADKVLNGKKVYTAFWSLPFDIAIAPISIAYYLLGRFAIAKTFVANQNCNQCGLCVKNCPVKAIKMIDSRPFWTFDCESCMHCMNHCPKRAIETALGFTLILWWTVFSIIPLWGLKIVIEKQILPIHYHSLWSGLIYYFFQTLGALMIIFGAYRLLHFLMKFSFFNKLVIYTSISRFKFWRRYKAPVNI